MSLGCIIIKANPVTAWETHRSVAYPAGSFGAELTYEDYSPEDRAEGGHWSASFTLLGPENSLKEMFEQGLGRHVEVWGDGLEQDFEGYIHEVVYTLPPNRYTVSLENMANRMFMRSDNNADGVVERSTTLQDAESQDHLGIKELVLSGGELSSLTVANQAVQAFLDLKAWPRPESELGGGSGEERLEIFCRGYVHTLGWRLYNQTSASGSQGASQEVQDIVGSLVSIPASLKSSLISWWSLDEVSGDRADSHGSNDLTDNATVGSAAGKQSLGGDFEAGSSEYLSRADNADLSTGNIDFAFACWFKVESTGVDHGIVTKGQDAGNLREWALRIGGDNLIRFQVSPDGTTTGMTTLVGPSIGAGTWYFVVVWHDATANEIAMQINNGTPSTAAHATGLTDLGGAFWLGRHTNGANYMDGIIDEAAFWKKVPTTTERTTLYNSGNGLAYGNIGTRIMTGGVAQFIAQTDLGANATSVTKVYDADRQALAIINDIARLGDSNNNRWLAYVAGKSATEAWGRNFVLKQAAPATVPVS